MLFHTEIFNTGSATDKIFRGTSSLGEDTGEDDGGFNFATNENYSDKYLGGSAEHRSEKDDCGMGEGSGTEAQPGEDGRQKGLIVMH